MDERRWEVVQRQCRRMVRNPDLAADQEVILRTLRQERILGKPLPVQWMLVAAKNLLVDHCRRVKRLPSRLEGDLVDRRPAPDETVSADEQSERFREVVARLPRRQREVMLRLMDGDSYATIADDLGSRQDSLRVLKMRAVRFVRAFMR